MSTLNRLFQIFNYYFAVCFAQFKNYFSYKFNYGVKIISSLINFYIRYCVWAAVFSHAITIPFINVNSYFLYVYLSTLISTFISSDIDLLIFRQIRSGEIAINLINPHNIQLYYFSFSLGKSLTNLLFSCVPTAVIIMLFVDFSLVFTLEKLIFFLLFVICGYVLLFLHDYIIGIVSIWTKYIHGLRKLRTVFIMLFSGSIIPLDLYPNWARRIADILPYKGIYYLPISKFLLWKPTNDWCYHLFIQICWIAFYFFLGNILWSLLIKKIDIQGG